MTTLKFILVAVAFIIIYGLVDLIAGLVPMWLGLLFLASIIVALIRLAFLIVKEANK